MKVIISLVATFAVAYLINLLLKKLGFTPEKNPYFGDDPDE